MYECVICLSLNGPARFQCQNCGTIPARYSMLHKPSRLIEHNGMWQFIQVVVAIGAVHSCKHHVGRSSMQTVPFDYYAEATPEESAAAIAKVKVSKAKQVSA